MILRQLLGKIVIDMGFVTRQQLDEALQTQRKILEKTMLAERLQRPSLVSEARLIKDTSPILGNILADMGFVTRQQLGEALEEQDRSAEVYRSLESGKLGITIEIGSLVNSTLNLNEVLTIIMRHVNRVTNSVASTLMLLDDKTGELVFSLPTGPEADKLTDIRLPRGKGIAGWVAQHEQPVLLRDAREDPRFYPEIDKISGIQTKSILCVPVKAKAKLIGVLEVINKVDKSFFTEEDALFLLIFASQAAIAIENARLYGELKESEEKYRLLVENANDAIFIAQDKVVKFPNPKAEAMIGYSAEEFAKIPFVDFIHPEDRDMVLDKHKRTLKGKEPPSTYSFRIINRAGEELWVQLNTVLITWEGRPATLNLLRDITQQSRLEGQLQRAQKMEVIGTLAGGVAHDLNNILSGLVSYPELLLLEIPEDSSLRNAILTIQKSGEKAVAIVQDLLTLARRGVAVKEVVNLNHIISEYLKSPEHERLMSFHPEVHVETDLEKDLLNILGSSVHLSKTVMNLVSNAAEAMPEGREILISTENRYVDRPIRGYDHVEEGDYVTLIVSDSGVGISSKDMERIFEPFYTKKVMGRSGTGLGMTVVYGTVKDHKGYIDIQSAEGKGTTFTGYFPVTRKEVSKDKSLLRIEDYMGRGESILVVDDVKEQREIGSEILKKLGYSVTSVSNGEEAVNYLRDNSADLLVLDMIMDPGIDGFETYKRTLELHPGQKAIIVSGFSETGRVKETQRLGAGAYVKKPFLLQKIGIAVRDELSK
ncbi:MAG: PAS domain S-box protein [Desulfobacterales bacterium]|nr:PAS domain S-box protein [Desulfobacterales bacterium]